MRRNSALILCLLMVCAVLKAQPYFSGRVVAVKSTESGRIEIQVREEKSGEFDAITPENPPGFTVRENGRVQNTKVELLPQANEVSRTVILADLSFSLTRRQFRDFKRAAIDFVKKLKPGDLVSLVTFHRRVYRELNFTGDRELLQKRIANLQQVGKKTMLYDALLEAHKMLRDMSPRKAIVVYTDGKENASRIRFDDLTEVYSAHPVPLFVAGNKKSLALKRLIRLARLSGGDAFRAEDRHDLAKVFSYLGKLRAHEYLLSYTTEQKPGSAVDLEIRSPQWGAPLVVSYTIPHGVPAKAPTGEKLFSSSLFEAVRMRMPEILLSLIVLLLIAVIVTLFFRRQEITVKVENSPLLPPVVVGSDNFAVVDKRLESSKAKLPLDYHHGWLVEKEGPHTGRKYRINWHVVTLGYADDCSIVIEDNTVSPRHAKIERQGNKFILYDLMSENGTWLNGKKLLRPKELNDFDEIGIGRTKLIFRKSAKIHDPEKKATT